MRRSAHNYAPPCLADRPVAEWERVEITSAEPEDPEMAGIVKKYQDVIGELACTTAGMQGGAAACTCNRICPADTPSH